MSVTSTRKVDADEAPKRNSRRRRERRWTIAYVLAALAGSTLGMALAIRLLALPVLGVLVGLAVAVVAVLALRTRFEMTPRAEGVGLALAAGVVVAAVLSSGAGGLDAAHDPNHKTIERVLMLDRELKHYASRADRQKGEPSLPRAAAFVAWVRALEVDGEALLRSPWGGAGQAVAIPLGAVAAKLPSAAQIAAGAPPVTLNMPLGAGRPPAAGPWGPLTYGAVLYDVDARGERYVLYGIGQVGDQAVVVHQAIGPR